MSINKVGYACINMGLKGKGFQTNRKMIKRTFNEKGIEGCGELALKNVTDLASILAWNGESGVLAYRMSSALFPWMSEYELKDLPQYQEICDALSKCGQVVKRYGLRLSFHPGAFTILASPKQSVNDKAIKELNQHSEIMDLIGLPVSHYSKINIHIGGAYGEKPETLDRFIENFKKLDINCQKRLTIENDDRTSLYTVEDLMYVHQHTGIPIVFDFHHYDCHPGHLSKKEALLLALSTWPSGVVPVVHMSSSKKLFEDSSAKTIAHADYIHDKIPYLHELDVPVDVMFECKMKEDAVLRYLKEYCTDTYCHYSDLPSPKAYI
jgi:UV DNA damage endonuclease